MKKKNETITNFQLLNLSRVNQNTCSGGVFGDNSGISPFSYFSIKTYVVGAH